MRSFLILLLLIQGLCLYGQSDIRKVSVSDLPQDIQNIHDVSTVVRWTDSLGDNVVVITKKVIRKEDEERIRNRDEVSDGKYDTKDNYELFIKPSFAYHFKIVHDSAILTWKVVGMNRTCEEEETNHQKSWFVVTDLNKDGRAEVWFIYRTECVEDENVGNMKIVMCESDIQYTMSGYIAGQLPWENYLDNNFRHGPEVFWKYALQLWQNFLKK